VIAGVVLAAGRGLRFGSQKLLHEVDGRPLLLHTVCAAVRSRLDEVHVVIAEGDRAVATVVSAAVASTPYAVVHHNGRPERGMMSSLKIALRSLAGRANAAVVMLGDMPQVQWTLIDALVSTYERRGGVVIPVSGGVWRHPRVIPARLFDEFLALPDDARGASVLERYDDDVTLVSGGSAERYLDVDRRGDIEALHPHPGGEPSRN